jgi:hypothetical protein
MSTTTHIPVEVYLRSSYEPDAEYVDGEIEQRPMGEFDHASWQLAILRWFLQHEKDWNIRVRPALRIQVCCRGITFCITPPLVRYFRSGIRVGMTLLPCLRQILKSASSVTTSAAR